MDLATFRELLTPTGQRLLAAATELEPTEATFLSCFDKLRKWHPAPLAKAALETILLRLRARSKFANADRMYFTREALEQASGEVISRHRAARFAAFAEVADLCCGIGADSLMLALAGRRVQAVELDPLHAAMAEANAAALGVADRVTVHLGDALMVPLPGVQAAFADPDRRSDGRRHLNPEDYSPALSAIQNRFPADFPLAVKIAPGVSIDDIASLPAEAEFISVDGELKECVLWFGKLQTAKRRATVLPAGATLAADELPPLQSIVPVGEYVFDPNAAVVRAGLAGFLAKELALSPIDYTVALFTGSKLVPSPFLTAYRVELVARVNPAQLRTHFRERDVGRLTIVKRGSLIDADELLKKLKLSGKNHRFGILTRLNGEQTMLVGERVVGPVDMSHC